MKINFAGGLQAEVVERTEGGGRILDFGSASGTKRLSSAMAKYPFRRISTLS